MDALSTALPPPLTAHLQRRRVRRDGRHDDRVVDRLEVVRCLLARVEEAALVEVARLAQDLGDTRDGALLLADADVDAVARLGRLQLVQRQLLRVEALLPPEALVEEALVEDRVERDRRLARLTVSNDQLALAEADRHHGVNAANAREEGAVDGLAVNDAGRVRLDGAPVAQLHVAGEVQAVAGVDGRLVEIDGAVLVVDGLPERVEHAAQEADADVDGDDTLAREDAVADLHEALVSENNDGREVALETDDHAVNVVDGALLFLERLEARRARHENDELAEGREAQVAREGDAVLDARHDTEAQRLDLLLGLRGGRRGLDREGARRNLRRGKGQQVGREGEGRGDRTRHTREYFRAHAAAGPPQGAQAGKIPLPSRREASTTFHPPRAARSSRGGTLNLLPA